MKRAALLASLFVLVLAGLSATEEWSDDAERAERYYRSGDYDAAWLFYERALSKGCDDGLVLYYAAESFDRQVLTENPEFKDALFAVARFFMLDQYPDRSELAATEDYASIVVNRRFLRETYAVVGAKAPKPSRPIAGFVGRIAGFFTDRVEDLGQFFSILKTEGLREGLAWAKAHAWKLLLAWILLGSVTGIILPVVMAVTVAKEGRKSYVTAYAFLLHWGALGIHRFYLGRYASGVIWLLTGGLAGLGVFFDLFLTGAYVRFWNEDHRELRPGPHNPGGGGRSRRERTPKKKRVKSPKPPKAKKTKAPKPPKPPKAKKKAGKKKKASANSDGAAVAGGGLAAAAGAVAASDAFEASSLSSNDDFADLGSDDGLGDLPDFGDLSGDDSPLDMGGMDDGNPPADDLDAELPPELGDDDFDFGS